jgi:hypothetical protein
LVRASVPAAGRSEELGLVEPLRERPLGLRVLDLVLRIRLAAVSLTVKCPLLFMTTFSKQLPSQYLAGAKAAPNATGSAEVI